MSGRRWRKLFKRSKFILFIKWKLEFLGNADVAFEGVIQAGFEAEKLQARLHAKIGPLEAERDWLKRNSKQWA